MSALLGATDWVEIFGSACGRGLRALDWGLPEPWVHAELFAELGQRAEMNGLVPFDSEIPYVTAYPVGLPKLQRRDWGVEGAVKWADITLHSPAYDEWVWLEFKVRHQGSPSRARKAALEARGAFRKDIVALAGLDAARTASTWVSPDRDTVAFWFDTVLKPHAPAVASGRHHYVAAFLQLGGHLDAEVWDALLQDIESWMAYRAAKSSLKPYREVAFTISKWQVAQERSLVLVEW